ncbi:MAG TPA: YggS family pyridoxal phosphate-dependent enzyme [Marinagarivorans sp.]
MTNISHNLAQIRQQIQQAAQDSHREAADILLLAVSKVQPIDAIRCAYTAGQRDFGENYAQELEQKATALHELGIIWHFIGPVQSNKTRLIAEHCHWLHSLDRAKIAKRLSEQRPEHLPPLQVCIQVNIDGEDAKSGVTPEQLPRLIEQVSALPNLQLRGLMAIPSLAEPKQAFKRMATLAAKHQLKTLSMGMSGDMAAAIAAGSTIVRIGTALFGPRPNPNNSKQYEQQ